MLLSFFSNAKRTKRWHRELREYRRLLAKLITSSRETDEERRVYYRRLERINVLYRRLY